MRDYISIHKINVTMKIHHYNKKKKEKNYHTLRKNTRIHFPASFYSISTTAFLFFFFFSPEEHLETFSLERSFKKASINNDDNTN